MEQNPVVEIIQCSWLPAMLAALESTLSYYVSCMWKTADFLYSFSFSFFPPDTIHACMVRIRGRHPVLSPVIGFYYHCRVFVSVATPGGDCATTLLLKDGQNVMTKPAYRDKDNKENTPLGLYLYIMAEILLFFLLFFLVAQQPNFADQRSNLIKSFLMHF